MKEYHPLVGSSQTKILSFLGVEKYDFILCLAKSLYKMSYKILVIDLSENGALSEAMMDTGEENGEHEQPVVMNYHQIDFVPHINEWNHHLEFYIPYLCKQNEEYDYVLIDYGFLGNNPWISQSSVVFLVTDMQKHHMNQIKIFLDSIEVRKMLIIRDMVNCKIKPRDLLPANVLGVNDEIFFMRWTEKDMVLRILLQHTRVIHTEKYSKEMIRILSQVLSKLEPEYEQKGITKALAVTWRAR